MPVIKEFSFIGVGLVYVDGRPLGNVDQLNFSVEEDAKDLRDFTSTGGGLANSVSRIANVTMTVQMRDFVAPNIALATRGSVSDVAGAAVTDESHTASLGKLIRLDHIVPTTVVVTDSGGVTTYIADTDYEVVPAGIIPLAGGAITEGETLLVDYDFTAQRVVEALTQAQQEYPLTFDGLNEAQSGKSMVIDAWRVKFSPVQSLDLIADDFGAIALTGRLIKDVSKGVGLSQYFRSTQVEV